jgi:hypothetical protein
MPKGYPRAKIDPDADGSEMPTAAEVARWKAAQMTAVKAPKAPRISPAARPPKKKGRRLKRLKVVIEDSPQLPLKRGKQAKPGTWTSVIHTILAKAGRGLLHSELRAEVAKTDLAERLANSDKGFYGGIAKLVAEDPPRLVKHKGRLFAPATHQKFMADVAAGRATDLEDLPHIGNASPFRDAILEAMKLAFTGGATSAEIIEELKKNPALISTVLRHPTHTYNVLARMIEHGELTKWNEKYFLGPKQLAA